MSFAAMLLLLTSVSASAGGQFFLKQSAVQLGKIDQTNAIAAIVGMVSRWQIWAGLTCYGLGLMTYILLLTKVNLSIASPLLATSYIFAVLIGVFCFQESISIAQCLGIALIFCGAVLLTQGKPVG
jgi:drug/metabolite transporter (DMT)-like permease